MGQGCCRVWGGLQQHPWFVLAFGGQESHGSFGIEIGDKGRFEISSRVA